MLSSMNRFRAPATVVEVSETALVLVAVVGEVVVVGAEPDEV